MLRTALSALVVFLVAGGAAADDKKAKPKTVTGTLLAFEEGTLTVEVKVKKEPTPEQFKVPDGTPVILQHSKDKQDLLVAPKALIGVEKGRHVQVKLNEESQVIEVILHAPKKPKKQ